MFSIISVLEDLCPRFNCLALDLRGSWRIWRGSLSLLFHHFVSCTSTTGSKTAQKHDSTTTFDNWYSVLWKPYIYSSNQKAQSFLLKAFGLCGQPSRAWRWWFWSRGFFLGWHPLITPGKPFREFPIHGRLELQWLLGCSWTTKPASSHLRVAVQVFFQILVKWRHMNSTISTTI